MNDFSDFTTQNYRNLIELALRRGYKFINYDEVSLKEPWIVWRHDVDFSPHRALRLARIESELGIRSTYFLLVHSRFYNLFEREVYDIVRNIKELGHTLALHFDFAFYGIKDGEKDEMLSKMLMEKKLLEDVFNVPIQATSFHNPTTWAIGLGDTQFCGMVNAYSLFFMHEVGYASDSNGYWRNESILSRLEEGLDRIQVLTHPVWWTDEITSPKQRFMRAVEGRYRHMVEAQLSQWSKMGRQIPDWPE